MAPVPCVKHRDPGRIGSSGGTTQLLQTFRAFAGRLWIQPKCRWFQERSVAATAGGAIHCVQLAAATHFGAAQADRKSVKESQKR